MAGVEASGVLDALDRAVPRPVTDAEIRSVHDASLLAHLAAVDAARTTDDDQSRLPMARERQGADGDVGALQRLDASHEHDEGRIAIDADRATGAGPVAGGEEGRRHSPTRWCAVLLEPESRQTSARDPKSNLHRHNAHRFP